MPAYTPEKTKELLSARLQHFIIGLIADGGYRRHDQGRGRTASGHEDRPMTQAMMLGISADLERLGE